MFIIGFAFILSIGIGIGIGYGVWDRDFLIYLYFNQQCFQCQRYFMPHWLCYKPQYIHVSIVESLAATNYNLTTLF